MADNYLGKKMEDHARSSTVVRKHTFSLERLLRRNRSHRAYDNSFTVREDQLRSIIEVNTLTPSARNQQVLRFRPVLNGEAAKVLPHIRLGAALPQLHLPREGEQPNAYIVVCSAVQPDKYVYTDLGIAVQSMLLRAVEIGLNGICIGAFDAEAVKCELKLEMEPLLIVAIGRGADRIELRPIREGEQRRYYRNAQGVHFVPKVVADDLIIK